jgi:FRG domain
MCTTRWHRLGHGSAGDERAVLRLLRFDPTDHTSITQPQYAERVGFEPSEAQALDASGIAILPLPLVAPLLEAQRDNTVLGSLPIDETNDRNQPDRSYFDVLNQREKRRPAIVIDKFYRAPFWARPLEPYALYGNENLLRDHYHEFYAALKSTEFVRCKHYCVPIIDVSSLEELGKHVVRIPKHNATGVVFRGQGKLYTLNRDARVKGMLFGTSCNVEPSLVTAASRDASYDYDRVHFILKRFLEDELARKDRRRMDQWIEASASPDCRLDLAILALAQHYGLPSHGLDVTRSLDIALWFATNIYGVDGQRGFATYTRMDDETWKKDRSEWPVVLACQTVTHSTMQSLHECQELSAFGFDARRPHRPGCDVLSGRS